MGKHELDSIAFSTSYVLKEVHKGLYPDSNNSNNDDAFNAFAGVNVGILAASFVLEKELGSLNKNIESLVKMAERKETSNIQLGNVLDSIERLKLSLQPATEGTDAPGEEE